MSDRGATRMLNPLVSPERKSPMEIGHVLGFRRKVHEAQYGNCLGASFRASASGMAWFLSLPTELICIIIEYSGLPALSALARTCRSLRALAEPVLYLRDGERDLPRALLWAVKSGETATITKSLQAGYDINLADNQGLTPLHHATCHIGDELVQFLLRNGAQINLEAYGVRTALEYAYEHQNFRSAIALVEAGACVYHDALCSCVRSIHVSSKEGLASDSMRELERLQEQLAQKLVTELSISDFRPRCHKGSTPLLCAVSNDDLPAMRLLLSLGVDVNAPDHEGITPLMIAVEKSNLDHVSVLLAAGADPNRYSHRRESAFFFLKPNNRMSGILKQLLEHSIDIPNCAGGEQVDMRQRVRALYDRAEEEDWDETRRRCLLSAVCAGDLSP